MLCIRCFQFCQLTDIVRCTHCKYVYIVLLLVSACLHGLAPCYLSDNIRRVAEPIAGSCVRHRLVHCLSGQRGLSPWATAPSQLPAVDSGTVCRTRSPLLPHCLFSPAVCFNFPSLPTRHFLPQASSGLAVLSDIRPL